VIGLSQTLTLMCCPGIAAPGRKRRPPEQAVGLPACGGLAAIPVQSTLEALLARAEPGNTGRHPNICRAESDQCA